MLSVGASAGIPRETFLEASGANLYFLDRVLRFIANGSSMSGRFLEIGCGTGVFAQCLALASGMTAYGTEISQDAYTVASKRLNCTLVDSIELPYENSYFSLVVTKDVLPMIEDKKAWFKEIFRVLDRGGCFISYFPNDKDFIEKPLYAFIEGSEAVSRCYYGQPHQIVKAMVDSGFPEPILDRLFLGNVRFDFMYVDKHKSGFFNNTESEKYFIARMQGLSMAKCGIAALNTFGITAHYEWERTLVMAEKI